jgi:hypothetical protein
MAQPPPPGPDWTVQAADRIEAAVAMVRDRTTLPLTTAARALVFGLVAAVMGTTGLVLLVVLLLRLHVYLPFQDDNSRKVWVSDAGLGAIFLVLGVFTWRKRRPRDKE